MVRRFFTENITLKISALALSVIFWVFVTAKGQTEITLNVPIQHANIPSGIEITSHTSRAAQVVIRGHESMLKNIRQGEVIVAIDLSKAKTGEGVFTIKKDDVKAPLGVSVMKVEPASVKIVFEETVSKNVSIKPFVTGSPEEGYYIKAIDIRPNDVIIEGPKSEIKKTNYIKTEAIDVTGLTEDLRQEAALDLSGRNIRPKIEKAEVHITIRRRGR